MKRICYIIVMCLLSVLDANSNPITREQALKQAQLFMQQSGDVRQLTSVASSRQVTPGVVGRPTAETSEYYVFNKGTGEGFVIVSGDDRTVPILGYCDEGEFDYDKMPPAMQELLDGYARQIANLQQSVGGTVICDAVPTHPKVEQLMKSKWSQGYPYNLTCPEYFTLGRSVTGCVATAMAQILYYNRDKSVSETMAAMPAYDTWTEHPTYGRLHVEGIPEGSPIDWENMKDEYGTATEKQRLAVADLMHYCGVAVSMDYTNSSSGAQVHDAYEAFIKYFGYGSSVRYYDYASVTSDTEWDRIIYSELAAGRPVYLAGANSEGGHAFVTDGYDGNQKYHINWGWGGTSDGYYLLTSLTPGQQGIGGSNDGYTSYRQIITGLEPENFGAKAMTFADATVKKLCIENWDADKDGKLTYGEAAQVTDIGTVFKEAPIKTFKELYYFTSVTALPDDAFNGCSQLTAIRLPKNVQTIGSRALKGCAKLPQIDMPNHVKTIGEEAFSGCRLLGSFSLPDELPAVNDRTFKGCEMLTTVSLPITVTRIGSEAFAGCSRFSSLDIKTFQPEGIDVDATAFAGTDLSKAKLSVMQGTKAYFVASSVWKDFGTIIEKRELSAGQFAELEAGKTYFLYHVGTGRYLTKGEAWGTQAVVGDTPMRFQVRHMTTMPEGVYYLTSDDTGKDGKYLFRTNTDSNVGNGIIATFVDGQNLTANAYWNIQPAGDRVYTIQIPSNGSGYAEGKFWGVQSDHQSNAASPTYGIYSDVDYAAHPLNCQWRFVLYDEAEMARYEAAEKLGSLLTVAKPRRLKVDAEQAVFDNLESSYDELRDALHTLRKKLGFIDFASDYVAGICVMLYDIDSDGELSYAEASKVSDLGWMFYSYFMNQTTLQSFDELQYFTNVPDIYGNTFEGCTNLESVVLPKNLVHIYYRAFRNCQKLTSIRIPEFVNTIGETCFYGCRSLRSVTILNPDPSSINLGENVFGGVPLKQCTLYVPYGSKQLYEKADVWKNFGTIVEVRSHTQPKFSPVETDVPGYIMNLANRKYISLGEAYGTQSVVAADGKLYQFKRTKSMADGIYYLYSDQTGKDGKVLFRTSTDTKVGDGVKACFGDGSLSAKAYWKIEQADDCTFTMQVPADDATYVADEYLGVQENHRSSAASPTYGLYWDVKDQGIRWAFVKAADMEESKALDNRADYLADMLERAKEAKVDVTDEQAVYDNFESTLAEINTAIVSVRSKLHYITFADSRVQDLCLAMWDSDADGELTFEEAADVKDIGEVFRNNTHIKTFEELRYFTSLTEIPSNAFRGAFSLQTLYLPAGIKTIGEYAFMGCSVLRNIVLFNDTDMIPMGLTGMTSGTTLFVPAQMVALYQADPQWSSRCTVVEYTGKPVVTAEASRSYGRTAAVIKVKVSGAPVNGTPDCTCATINNRTAPVGTYPIVLTLGTITTPGVELQEGVFTIEPATLTLTAMSYTRYEGEPNPEFELTVTGYRNRETDTVFTVRPVITCEATASSPAGEYDIIVSGAEAHNYLMEYVAGKLTVLAGTPDGIHNVTTNADHQPVYDLQGRPVVAPRRGIYVKGRRKLVVK